MATNDSHKRFGLIGLSLVVAAFVVWAFILPRLDNKPSDQTIDDITSQPQTRQSTPQQPINEPPVPPRPTD